jgi:hypothetical protein
VGALLTVAVGLAVFPELRVALDGRGIAWGWLLFYLVTGVVLLIALGLILAGAVLNMARYGIFLSAALRGGFPGHHPGWWRRAVHGSSSTAYGALRPAATPGGRAGATAL